MHIGFITEMPRLYWLNKAAERFSVANLSVVFTAMGVYNFFEDGILPLSALCTDEVCSGHSAMSKRVEYTIDIY